LLGCIASGLSAVMNVIIQELEMRKWQLKSFIQDI
jgi:hypothetical protein